MIEISIKRALPMIVILTIISTSSAIGMTYNKWTVVRQNHDGITDRSVSFFHAHRYTPYLYISIYKANRKEKAFYGKGVDDYIAVIGGKQQLGGTDFSVKKSSLVTIVVDDEPVEVCINQNNGKWAIVSLNRRIIDQFKKGYTLKLAFQATNGRPSAKISLIGFSKQFNLMIKEKGSKSTNGMLLTEKDKKKTLHSKLLEANQKFEKEIKTLLEIIANDALEFIDPRVRTSIKYVRKIDSEKIASQAIKVNHLQIQQLANRYIDYVWHDTKERQKYIDDMFEMFRKKIITLIERTKQKTLNDNQ